MEEETALSIVEPAALHVHLRADAVLHVAMGTLNLRLSYHDMRMFASMLRSLPAQVRVALSREYTRATEEDAPANSVHMHRGGAAGPPEPDARNQGGGAGGPGGGWGGYWLRGHHAPAPPPLPSTPPSTHKSSIWPLKAVQVYRVAFRAILRISCVLKQRVSKCRTSFVTGKRRLHNVVRHRRLSRFRCTTPRSLVRGSARGTGSPERGGRFR
ncbi:unnamed protein product [Diatraea saccharalis]|uniref:Uncharacterized protein n=1 Tax=Diatraea saccharalis TaxID=40085 RepID=A0A9N9QUC2_9NEOP|nr:unnamed protein product [Diatraea saccharalis]